MIAHVALCSHGVFTKSRIATTYIMSIQVSTRAVPRQLPHKDRFVVPYAI